jgi:hypothetical protein
LISHEIHTDYELGNITGGAFDWTIDQGLANAEDYYIMLAQDTVFSYSEQFAIGGATKASAIPSADQTQPSATLIASGSLTSVSSASSTNAAVVAVASSSRSLSSSIASSSTAVAAVSASSATAEAQALNGTSLAANAGGNGTETLVGGHVPLGTGGIVGIVMGVIAILIGISTMGIFALVLKMLKKHGPPPPPHDDVEELSSLGPARSMNLGPGGGPNGGAPNYYPKRTNSADSDSSGVLGRGGLNGNPTRPYDDLGSPETLVARRGDEEISLVASATGSGRISPNDRFAAAAGAAHPGQQVNIGGGNNGQEGTSRSPTSVYEHNSSMPVGFAPGEYRYGGNVGGYESGDTDHPPMPPPLQSRPGTGNSDRTLAYGDGGRMLMGGSPPGGGSRLRNQV